MSDATSTRNLCLGVAQSLRGRAWYSVTADNTVVADLALSLDLPDAVAGILAARGLTPETAQPFLNPRLRDLMPDPSSLAGMNEAVSRLVAAIQNEERVVVFGDYDVDGATSSALLIKFFRALGVELESYIPDRVKEGYGPNAPALLKLRDDGASVAITVDCGITAFEPLSAAQLRAWTSLWSIITRPKKNCLKRPPSLTRTDWMTPAGRGIWQRSA